MAQTMLIGYHVTSTVSNIFSKDFLKFFEVVTFRVSKRKRLFAEPLRCCKDRHYQHVMCMCETEEALEIIFFFLSQIRHSFQTLCPVFFA